MDEMRLEKARETLRKHLDDLSKSPVAPRNVVLSCVCEACWQAAGFISGHKAGRKEVLESPELLNLVKCGVDSQQWAVNTSSMKERMQEALAALSKLKEKEL